MSNTPKQVENAVFLNALREFLGLDPLYQDLRDNRRRREDTSGMQWLESVVQNDGNRQAARGNF